MSNGKIAGDSEVAHHCKYAYRDIYCHLDDYEKICIVCNFSIKKEEKLLRVSEIRNDLNIDLR